jgi:periplasmic protein TonB
MHRFAGALSTPFQQAMLFSVAVHLATLAWVQSPHPSMEPILTVLEARLESVRVPVVAPPSPPSPPPPVQQPVPPSPLSPPPSVQAPVPLPLRAPTPVSASAVVAVPVAVVAVSASPSVQAIAPVSAVPVVLAAPRPIADAPWHPVAKLDAPPKHIDQTRLVYPSKAQREGVQGWVKARMQVNAQGVVEAVEIVAAQPPEVFDAAALAFFRQARYQPPLKDGQAVRATIEERVRFTLNDDAP